MKRIRAIVLSFFMLLATSCSLLGGAHDAKAKEGWEMIQSRKGETYYESCEWYHVIDMGAVVGGVYENGTIFDNRVFYHAYNDTTGVGDYWEYNTKSGQLKETSWETVWFVERNASGQEPNIYSGVLGKAAEENAQN